MKNYEIANDTIAQYCVDELIKLGANKAACRFGEDKMDELSAEAGKINLLRTNFGYNISISAIIDNKKGSISVNQPDKNALDSAIARVLELAKSSQPDEAHDISDFQKKKEFSKGPESANHELMIERLDEFIEYISAKYPKTILEQVGIDFTRSTSHYCNSNGVHFTIKRGGYSFSPMFTSKEGNKASSFNYSGFSAREITKPLHEYGTIEELIRQSSEQIHTKPVPEKFVGDLIFTPDSIGDIFGIIAGFISGHPIISGTSVYKDKLNQQIASKIFTLRSMPRSEELETGYFVTGDGFEAQNSVVIENGILKTFLLGLYGANKTGLEKAVNSGGSWIVDAGKTPYKTMLQNTKRGILLGRFSGGRPNDSGDFSGVAKNSYYIENGEIQYAISETMVSGNIVEMLMNVLDISTERVNFGGKIVPFMRFGGITVSGK